MAGKQEVTVNVGRRLRELRERAGLPKEQVALALGMSAGNWAHYESGRNQLAVPMLPTIAESYGMPLADLLAELFDLRTLCDTPEHNDPRDNMRQDKQENIAEGTTETFSIISRQTAMRRLGHRPSDRWAISPCRTLSGARTGLRGGSVRRPITNPSLGG